MHRFSLLVLSFFILTSTSLAQPQSNPQDELSKVDRLYYTCKIWGFLKYYHPLVSKGSYDWDEKLDKAIAATSSYKTYEEFSDYMARWIYYMGQIKPCIKCKKEAAYESFLENFDLSWTQDQRFSEELRKSLKNIEENRFIGNNHYIGKGRVLQFEPKNELPGYDKSWKIESNRLLPLFRYWNYVEYFFPYKYLTDQPWDDVLKEMIPKFLEVESTLDWHLAMLELVVKVDDSHAGFETPIIREANKLNYFPTSLRVIQNQVVITKIVDSELASKSNLQVGDIVLEVNGKSAIEIHKSRVKYTWGSNEAAKNRSAYFNIFSGVNKSAELTIQRGDEVFKQVVPMYGYADLNIEKDESPKWKHLSDSVGYVDMGRLVIKEVDEMMAEMMSKTVIIFDIRNYPKGTYKAIAKYLKPNSSVFAKFTRPNYDYPGKFNWSGESECGEENEDYFKGKVILLVDERTQSHAEFTCMCLQTAPDVVTIGSQTSGADGNVTRFSIIQRLNTSLSGIGVYYPDGGETQRVGIVPDILSRPTILGIGAGKDEVLEKALEVAQDEVSSRIAKAKEEMLKAAMDSLLTDSLAMPIDTIQVDSLEVKGN